MLPIHYAVTPDGNYSILNGLKVIQLSRIKHPDTAFVIVSGYDDFSYCREALRRRITTEPEKQEERTITGITRYLQAHLAEVAERSGYGDYRVFTKVFKKSEGVTPSQYRRDFLEEAGK